MRLKFTALLSSLILLMSALTTDVQAMSWGETGKNQQFGEAYWYETQCDLLGMDLSFYLPTSFGSEYKNGTISFKGTVSGEDFYFLDVVPTTWSPKNENDFLKVIKDANPGCTAKIIDARSTGAAYAVEMTLINDGIKFYNRYLQTKGYFVVAGTTDANVKNQKFFFDSIKIK